jgi:hypothetical protein
MPKFAGFRESLTAGQEQLSNGEGVAIYRLRIE